MAVKYPHMFGYEAELWEIFLDRYGKYFERFEYDVHLGQGVPLEKIYPPEIVHAAKVLTQKRVDVVGYREEEVWIIEVKPDAGLSALGQLLGYRALWIRDRGEPAKLELAVVTDILNPDEEYLFEHYGIRTYIVTEAGSTHLRATL